MPERLQIVQKFWEGIYTVDFTLEQMRRRCSRLGVDLLARGWDCLIAHDTRFMSNLFARDVYRQLDSQGVPVYLFSATPAPLPSIRFALEEQRARCALVVSARNRPYWFNGLVFLYPDIADIPLQPDGEISGTGFEFPQLDDIGGGIHIQNLRDPYLAALQSHIDVEMIRRSALTIFADPIHGTTAGYLPAIITESGQARAIEINRDPDPLFGRNTPLPAEASLARMRKLVRESDSHLGLAFSADGTALSVVDKNGDRLEHLEVALLLAAYLMRQYRQKGIVIVPPPAADSPLSQSLVGIQRWEDATGIHVELSNDAKTRINEVLAQDRSNLLIGCTAEGEIIQGQDRAYPDALRAGLLIIELAARNGGNLRSLLDELRGQLLRKS